MQRTLQSREIQTRWKQVANLSIILIIKNLSKPQLLAFETIEKGHGW